jgi:hypothetical protein
VYQRSSGTPFTSAHPLCGSLKFDCKSARTGLSGVSVPSNVILSALHVELAQV